MYSEIFSEALDNDCPITSALAAVKNSVAIIDKRIFFITSFIRVIKRNK